jgi:hypothetical protein
LPNRRDVERLRAADQLGGRGRTQVNGPAPGPRKSVSCARYCLGGRVSTKICAHSRNRYAAQIAGAVRAQVEGRLADRVRIGTRKVDGSRGIAARQRAVCLTGPGGNGNQHIYIGDIGCVALRGARDERRRTDRRNAAVIHIGRVRKALDDQNSIGTD